MSWSVAEARARFSEVLQAAESAPQVVSNRGRPVAVIVSPEEFEAFESWHRARGERTLADALDTVRLICAEEDYALEVPPRRNRPNAFVDEA
jgi:prevent-host-death family protein